MFRADAGIVQAGRNAVGFGDLAVLILQQIGAVAVQDAGLAAGQARGMFPVQSFARCLDADHRDLGIVEEGVEHADRIGSAADRRDQHVGQAAFGLQHLRAGFLADHRLEIAHQFGIGMRPRRRADDVESVVHIRHPVAQRIVHRILQRRRSRMNRDHFGAEQLHAKDVGLLPLDILRAHEDLAFQAE